MTNTEMKNLTPDQLHLERLRQHGARVLTADGDTELNSYFVGNAVNAFRPAPWGPRFTTLSLHCCLAICTTIW